jgi:hypothetical protein
LRLEKPWRRSSRLSFSSEKVEREKGFEPSTSTLAREGNLVSTCFPECLSRENP